ncbi:MAG: pantoate--beta-alanine ligase [Flavisolibacter sp.]
MIIFKSSHQLSHHIENQKKTGRKTGFVPTMGALHKGHLSLIKSSKESNDLTICSIFINPTQFNNAEDFKLYPVTIEKDLDLLISNECDVLFLPTVTEMYPPGHKTRTYALGQIENILEGYYRPGHFQGVCQVVDRLLEIVQPHQLFLGQKDFQQCMVIKKLLSLLNKSEIVLEIVPTAREHDGLAMSSRNLRLNEEQRKIAPFIYKELRSIQDHLNHKQATDLKAEAIDNLTKKGFHVDYIEIAKSKDLSPTTDIQQPVVAVAAASLGNIRLIDNLLLN